MDMPYRIPRFYIANNYLFSNHQGCLFYFLEQVRRKNEIVQGFVVRVEYSILISFPTVMSLIDENDIFSNAQY